jgi:hypothetical protein
MACFRTPLTAQLFLILGLLVFDSVASAQINDNIANAVNIPSVPFADTLSNVDADTEAGEPLNTCGPDGLNSIWWKFTATSSGILAADTYGSDFDTILSVYRVAGSLVEVGCSDDAGGGSQSEVTFSAQGGSTYYFRIVGHLGDEGDAVFNLEALFPNTLAGAVVINSIPFTDSLSNVGASLEPSEATATCGTDGGNSVWWRYTAGFSGSIVADTDSSDFDTILSVHTGSSHPLTEIACDDDGGSTAGQSRISFNVTGGTTYFFRVVGSGGEDGNARFRLRTLPGDNLADARPASAFPFSDTLSTIGASMEDSEALPGCGSGGTNSVWWSYTPAQTDSLIVSTDSSGFDTILSIHTGSSHPLAEEACDDDSGAPGGRSRLGFKFLQGTTYYIRVAGFEGASGDAIVSFLVPPAFKHAIWFTGRVFLEGPYASAGTMSVPGPFTSSIPLKQPYSDPAYDATYLDYDGADSVLAWPADAIDWLLISLRTGTGPETEVSGSEKAVILLNDGSVVDTDADSVDLAVDSLGSYYIVLRHRNHLSVMSSAAVDFSSIGSWDFTTASSQAFGSSPMTEVETGVWAMFAGEATTNDLNNASDFNAWLVDTKAIATGYLNTDFDLDGQVTAGDFNLWLANTKAVATSQVP